MGSHNGQQPWHQLPVTSRQTSPVVRHLRGVAERTARKARKVPGVGVRPRDQESMGAVAGQEDLAIADYDRLTANEITDKLPNLSQIDPGEDRLL